MKNLLQIILNNKKQKGFTLIELMVSISIFTVIMLAAMGSLIISSNAAKEAKALRIAMDNVNFAMENMTRNLRMGDKYTCDVDAWSSGDQVSDVRSNCSTGGNAITFYPAESPTSRYMYQWDQYNGAKLQKCILDSSNVLTTCVDIVSPAVTINNLKFYVNGSSKTDGVAPSVYIIMSGSVTIKGKVKTFAIQTMAAQRSNE